MSGLLNDAQGQPVSGAGAREIEAIDKGLRSWLRYEADVANVIRIAAKTPGCPTLNLMAAGLLLSMDETVGVNGAKGFLAKAKAVEADATDREKLTLGICEAWAGNDVDRALDGFERLTSEHPRDMFWVKMAQIVCFNVGDAQRMLRFAERALPHNRDCSHLLGMYAFGLEETNRLAEAEEAARKAVSLDRQDPWAHHAVAHVMETQGRMEEGIAWMESLADSWLTAASFMRSHNWWHTSLFYIDSERPERALSLYDSNVWGVDKKFSQDQINAISLLARLELRGVDVGDRWRDVANHVAHRLHEHCSAFLDLQYLYGLARAGERAAVTEMLASIEARAESAKPWEREAWVEAAVPAAHGLAAYAKGDWQEAATLLARAQPHIRVIGGSHAQRALFDDIQLDASIRAGWNDRALATLREWDRARTNVPWIKRAIAGVSENLGRAEDAAAARDEAERLQRRYRAA